MLDIFFVSQLKSVSSDFGAERDILKSAELEKAHTSRVWRRGLVEVDVVKIDLHDSKGFQNRVVKTRKRK